MRILVTGGAGYIGSVVVASLLEAGHEVAVLDNLVAGHRSAVDPRADFLQVDLIDREALQAALSSTRPDAVCHLAAEVAVGESVRDPGLHYRTNVVGSLCLADAMVQAGIGRIVFSSSAAVYGYPERVPIGEDAPLEPVNPYGETKLVFERALAWYGRAHGLRHISLRYFNACGATATLGEYRRNESHIVPLLLETALGQRSGFAIFGDDYPTPDGTCVRDYVHVADIASAHVLALESLDRIESAAFNIGIGKGSSNREVVEAAKRATGTDFPVSIGPRREGDPPQLVAQADRIRNELGWTPRFTDLDEMVATAWAWRKQHPTGY